MVISNDTNGSPHISTEQTTKYLSEVNLIFYLIFLPIIVVDAKIIFCHHFVSPLNRERTTFS